MFFSETHRINAIRDVLSEISSRLDLQLSVRLWDGSSVPMCDNSETPYYISISEAGVLGSIIRKPTPENLLRHYATGRIDFGGGDLIDIGAVLRQKSSSRKQLKKIKQIKQINLDQVCPTLFIFKTQRGKARKFLR